MELLPDDILCHVMSFVLDELRRALPLVCTRFRGICMLPQWYAQFTLQMDPLRFDASGGNACAFIFEFGDTNRVNIRDAKYFVSKYSTVGFPWRQLAVLDLYLVPNQEYQDDATQECIDTILPQLRSIQISPTTHNKSDIMYLNDELFGSEAYPKMLHLSLNGRVTLTGIHNIFCDHLPNIKHLELNNVCYPEIDWITNTISAFDQLIVLDLWRCEWKETSSIVLGAYIELFRIFGCTVNTILDLTASTRIRIISTDCRHCLQSNDLFTQIQTTNTANENRIQITLSHITSTTKCIKVLNKMCAFNIASCRIIYTRDMVQIWHELQEAIAQEMVTNNGITVMYGKLKLDLFAASKNYALFRKLVRIGRLGGTFVSDE
eukprot:381038_1